MNISKARDPRFRKLWADSKALETYQAAVAREKKKLKERERAMEYADYVLREFTNGRICVGLSANKEPVLYVPKVLNKGFSALTKAMKGNSPSEGGLSTINAFFQECKLKLIATVPEDDALSIRGDDWPKFLRFACAVRADYRIKATPKPELFA